MQNKMTFHVANATKWSALTEIFAKIITPIVNSILARLLDPEMFGVVASITIIISFADIFTDAGFQKYIIQHEYDNEKDLKRDANVAFTSNFLLSSLIYILIFIFRKSLAKAVGCPDAYNALSVAAISILCTSFSSICVAQFRRNLNFKPLFYIRLGSSMTPLLVTVPLAFVLRTYWALVLGVFIQNLFVALVSFVISTNKPRLLFDFSNFRGMFSFSIWNLCESVSIWFTGQASVFIVVNILNTYYLGLYRNGMAMINSYMAVVTSAVMPVLFAALSRVQNNPEEYRSIFSKIQTALGILIVPMGVGVFVFRELAVKILFGDKWSAIVDFTGLWALMSACVVIFGNVTSEVYRSKGKPKVSFVVQTVYLLFYIPVVYFSARVGFKELCLWSSLIRLFPLVLDIMILKWKFDIEPSLIFKNVCYSFFAAILMGICGYALKYLSDNLIWQFASVAICALVYFAVQIANPRMRKSIFNMKLILKK